MIQPELPPRLLAALASRIGAIPGCHLEPHVGEWSAKSMKPGTTGYKLTVEGWSPSLHSVTMDWRMALDPTEDEAAMTARALTILGHKIKLQKVRAAEGLALGTAFPMRIKGGGPRIDHLHADATALAIRIGALGHPRTPARDALHVFGHHVQELHNSAYHDGSITFVHAGTTINERAGKRLIVIHTGIPQSVDPNAATPHPRLEIGGRRIFFPGVTLSDTILTALAGRPLFSVTPLGPLLDMRIIESAVQRKDGTEVILVPVDVAMADVWDIERDEAIALLARRIAGSACTHVSPHADPHQTGAGTDASPSGDLHSGTPTA